MVFTIIWNLHDQLPFVLAIQAFLIISHVQIQRGKCGLLDLALFVSVLCPEKGTSLALLTVLIATIVQWQSGLLSKQLIQSLTNSL
jgi:hypothetical protein